MYKTVRNPKKFEVMVRGNFFINFLVRQIFFQYFLVRKLKKFGKHCSRHTLFNVIAMGKTQKLFTLTN